MGIALALWLVGCVMTFWGKQILILSIAFAASSALAVKMDETTHDQVISRLEMGLDALEKGEPARTGVMIRLADLYADRARLKAMNEVAAGCLEKCPGSKADRDRAIVLYNSALPAVEKAQQGRTILQLAHLYSLNDDNKKSVDLYNQILKARKNQYSSEVKALANSALGEIAFRKADFKTALKYYTAARAENLKNRALAEYRIAWCELNLGRTDKATKSLIKLLRDPNLLATQSADGQSVDPAFVQDVSKDLAKFLARGKVGPREISLLRSLSPDNQRKTNLHTLGTELDRVGNKNASLIVWAAYVDEGDVQPIEKLEVQARVAKIFYDMNKLELATNAFEKALGFWAKHGCPGDEDLCGELKTRLKAMVTAWNKAQKKKPTTNLFRVYLAYTNVFQDDVEMCHWAAVVGKDLGKHRETARLFHQAAAGAYADLQKPKDKRTAGLNETQLKNILEGSLLGEIEMAEAAKDAKAKEAAYNYYLQINPTGDKAFEVRYQRAQLFYSTNRFQEAFSEFHYLASMPGKEDRDLKIKSADLALDSLVALKDDQNLQVRSLEYARFFPERKDEYLKISRKATMNIVAGNLKNEKSVDRSDYKANLAALAAVNMDGADDAEKIKFYKNKITIAQKALALTVVTATANQMLTVKKLSPEDREWALEQKVWVAELQLNFHEAYKITLNMSLPRLSKTDRQLRLALLAELAGENARKHHEAYLALNPPVRAGNLVRITLIKNASNPWKELNKHVSNLKLTPDLLAGIALEVFAKNKDLNKAEHLLKTTAIGKYAAGETIARHLALRDLAAFDRKIRAHRIQGFSESAMQKTLKERLKLLTQCDKNAQGAFRKHDWTLQVLSLSMLARENRRMYKDIVSLPVPKRLNAQERAKYVALIKQQSEPYQARAEKIEAELSDIWSNSDSVQNLQTAYMTSSPELQRLYRDEISPLAVNAPSGAKNRLLNLLNTPYRRPSQRDILVARRELQAHPFDVSKAQNLRALEAAGGRPAMVAYLDERISQLKKGINL